MLLGPDHKFAFLHAPKTGGSSMSWALAPYSLDVKSGKTGIPRPNWKKRTRGWQARLTSIPGPGHNAYRYVRDYIPKDYFTFAFVRNPFELVYSSWARNLETKANFVDDFKSYIKGISEKKVGAIHARWTQWQYLSYKGSIAVDFVGRFESIEEDWDRVTRHIGLEGLTLPRLNQNEEKDTSLYRSSYTPVMRAFMEKRYKKDLEEFGYEF